MNFTILYFEFKLLNPKLGTLFKYINMLSLYRASKQRISKQLEVIFKLLI